MPIQSQDETVVATRSFETVIDDETFQVVEGRTRVRADDPLVKAHPGVWRKATSLPTVEQMTAAPGEERG